MSDVSRASPVILPDKCVLLGLAPGTGRKKLNVKYNDRTVGTLVHTDGRKIAFQYDDKWIRDGFSISPFSLPLTHEIYPGGKDTFGGLYAVFNDSLPDGWGELLVMRMLARKGMDYSKLSLLTKLSIISPNGLGGLTYFPSYAENEPRHGTLDELARQAAAILENKTPTEDLDDIYYLGGSSGGARPKAHIATDGAEWILKFPCRLDPPDIGLQEYEANRAAEKCGLRVNGYKLFPSARCSGYFGAKRFDRNGNRRLHMISLSALLETSHRLPNLDYMHLFQVISEICANESDIYEAYGRMCFNVMYGNKDDHGKNFAFLFDEDAGSYVLSPAYDLTKTPYKPEHEMTVLGNGSPDVSDLRKITQKLKLSAAKCETTIRTIKTVTEE